MNNIFIVAFLLFNLSAFSQEDELWALRSEQYAKDEYLFKKFTNRKDSTFPTSTGLLKRNDTIHYSNGQFFRLCQVNNNRLHGSYQVFYPNGKIYCNEQYKNGYQSDTSTYFSENGTVLKQIIWITSHKYVTYFFSENGRLNKKYVSKYPHIKP